MQLKLDNNKINHWFTDLGRMWSFQGEKKRNVLGEIDKAMRQRILNIPLVTVDRTFRYKEEKEKAEKKKSYLNLKTPQV